MGKTILLSGGAGGVGEFVARRLAAEGHTVRVFDLKTPKTEKVFSAEDQNIELHWGDIGKIETIAKAAEGVDEVFHLAAIVPPYTEQNPDLCRRVNIEGTANMVKAVKAESERTGKKIPFRFSSSVTVYGITNEQKPPIPPDQPVNPCDHYSRSKVEAEKIVKESGLPWTIFRFSAAVYLDIRPGGFSQMRIIPVNNRIEFVHIYDIADAFVKSVGNEETYEKTFIMGGGPKCQMLYGDQIKKTFAFLGFPDPNWKKFSKEPFNLDWYDTSESQRILGFQTRSFEDYLQDFKKALGIKYFLFKYLAGPLMKLFRIRV